MLLFSLPFVTTQVRGQGFQRAALRMQPLVLGIARYEQEHGGPPRDLDMLVPAYASDVGSFGVRGCRPLGYRTGSKQSTWELRLECPNGWTPLDQFFYRPGERYSKHEYNERMHGWAYFWD